MIKPQLMYGSGLREPTIESFGFHKVSKMEERISRYGFEVAPRGNVVGGASEEMKTNLILSYDAMDVRQYSTLENYLDFTACAALADETGRKGWRVPNQSELVLMSRMGLLDNNEFASLSVRHWLVKNDNNTNNKAGTSILIRSPFYMMSTVIGTQEFGYTRDWTSPNTPNKWLPNMRVRCVRDLTAAESGMTYQQILNSNK